MDLCLSQVDWTLLDGSVSSVQGPRRLMNGGVIGPYPWYIEEIVIIDNEGQTEVHTFLLESFAMLKCTNVYERLW